MTGFDLLVYRLSTYARYSDSLRGELTLRVSVVGLHAAFDHQRINVAILAKRPARRSV